ncbi:hypothetical protein M446_2212 [Methylobacterium sp. 4-46]|uniref:T4 RnlA family RNA ligase n=1 Tax=unclassified Methylobacterium TaxID=2615210 RepID=UPI000152CD39|nr:MULTISPECIES: T4 RnlA family RNA ligase [Methylobacterium]ACA16673.1 hypothetical protein M446_2212 [Methylobacterium sp. 4-46]WFT82375.1 T4 RnlA family RNA ligase [Methylobacterium nodulans]
MRFATIRTLDDVLPHVSFERGFVVARGRDCTVVDHVRPVPETFGSPVSLECRGLKFDRDGQIIARPFHKFFELGERQRLEEVDWSAPHAVLDKLDGVMVHPVLLDGRMVFMTRAGATAPARAAQAEANAAILDLSRFLVEGGITPLFEFTSPEAPAILACERPLLTLLAAREMVSGAYLTQPDLAGFGIRFGVRVVAARGMVDDPRAFVARARREEGIEGYVVAFDDGHRVKVKTEAYRLRLRAITGLQRERTVLAWVATGAVDEVAALLPAEAAARLRDHAAAWCAGLATQARAIRAFVAEHAGLPVEEAAARARARFDPRLHRAVRSALGGREPGSALRETLLRAAASDAQADSLRGLFGPSWSPRGLALPELEP